MRFLGKSAGVIAAAAALSLTAGVAGAATLTVTDPRRDALGATQDEIFDRGAYDIDLIAVDIDHGTRDLTVTARFADLTDDSWSYLVATLDTDGDGKSNFGIAADERETVVLDAWGETICTRGRPTVKLGIGGQVSMTVPRACLANPQKVAVHVDVIWEGYNRDDEELYFVDSAPGEFAEDVVTFSRPVLSSNTGSATSPQPAKVLSSVAVKLTKKTVRAGKPVKITVTPKAAGSPKGRVEIVRNGKVVKKISARAGKKVSYTFPKTLKPGKHTVKVTFRPHDTTRYKASSKTVKFTVKK